ncbi:longiborneol synthase [Trichoderma citrinoviride]|uniref:Longiborneol synthase n=1 Tax=Trichoderma citrinoviride TaxID=58853 RepID=A0A2T4BA59_9HYPO|nr:longiborneol synthase [Trichoderma citrinoviride]PTB66206.1 longiborneol synthase [Trichoderma citrinoviride]
MVFSRKSQNKDASCHTAAASACRRVVNSLKRFLPKKIVRSSKQKKDLPQDPEKLAAQVGPICSDMLKQLKYPGAPKLKAEAVEGLLAYMHKRAIEFDVPLNTPISAKGFRLGYAEGLLAHPNHPVQVQGYVGLFTWLVVQYDDIVGLAEASSNEMYENALKFHSRFFRGEPQGNNLLEGIAILLREADEHFDTVMANMLQISVLKFLTSNLLERSDGFQKMEITRAGIKFPDFYRDMSGMDVAYAVFCYPKEQYPDSSAYIEAIPDMANFINISNDVLSFYKEELGGDTRNYLHNRAATTGKPILEVLEDVNKETLDSAKRVEQILKGRGVYEQSWLDSVRGYMSMHTTNPRYKMSDMGLGEEHPLAPFEHKIGEFFDRVNNAS